ncbi:hypothetical protein LTR62_000340 [Meristemomyces frigidus]|uniref:PH domain-containing protein n=1 Tax=Meristemomyces frigidus TaxID=1508187 RepID=A0AAN7TSP9_9PEZI|nr:hypothetical protein LTR62_000340 [Meristemomyces frigidus]
MSPVTKRGHFDFDRVIKNGQVLKRTRRTKSWKPVYLVLRPNLLSIYRDSDEDKLRHQVNLSDLTAVARQRDPKGKAKYVFGLFSPSRNFHLGASSDKEAQEWVELIRREARMDGEDEEEMDIASPGGTRGTYRGFERSIDAIATGGHERGGYSSSEGEDIGSMRQLPKQRDRGSTSVSAFSGLSGGRRTSQVDYSGPDHGSYSDFSDSVNGAAAARLSALSLAYSDTRPSTSSQPRPSAANAVYGATPGRPPLGVRNPSQMSVSAGTSPTHDTPNPNNIYPPHSPSDNERVIYHGRISLLRSNHGVRQWKKVWMVLRPKALAIYKSEEEYTALLIIPFDSIIDVVEIDPLSRTKTACMQVLGEERSYRFCAGDEESLARWLGAFKSLLWKRRGLAATQGGAVQAVVVTPAAGE